MFETSKTISVSTESSKSESVSMNSRANSISDLLDSDGDLVNKDSLSNWLVDGGWAGCMDIDEDGFLDLFFVLNVAKLVDGDEVVSGLGDLIVFNSEIFLGNLFGSLFELKKIDINISVGDVVSSSLLSSAGAESCVAGGANSLWSGLNIGDEEISLLSHSSWSVDSISSGLSDVEWLLSLLDVSDSLGGGGINSEWSLLNDIDVGGSSNWDSVSVGSDKGGGEWELSSKSSSSKVASNISVKESGSLNGCSESSGIN